MIVIGGATGTGKTELGIEVAKKINGEIISADSMQIYKYLDIGTAKLREQERNIIPHHLIDIILPNEKFSVAEYKKIALEAVNDIKNRGKEPILVGGTGLYINSLLYDYHPYEFNKKLREDLMEEYNKFGADFMYEKLCKIDPKAGEIIHKNNIKRIIRAIEVKTLSGESLTDKHDIDMTMHALIYVLSGGEREELYERINKRVDKMFELGLENEVKNLLDKKMVDFSCQSMQAIGYKEFGPYMNGEIDIEEVKEKIKQHTRNYAKRQITWFKNIETAIWFKNETLEDKTNRIVGDYYKYYCNL